MKKHVILVVCLLVMAMMFSACTGEAGNVKEVEGSMEDILQRIYDGLDESARLPMTVNTALSVDMGAETPPTIEYYLGTKDIAFTEGIASEPMMSSQAYSLVLIRLDENADIEQAKTLIKDNVNPQKWICVGVDPSNVIVDNIGRLVVLIMSDQSATALHESFLKLAE